MNEKSVSAFASHRAAIDALESQVPAIEQAAQLAVDAVRAGGQVLFCGNGGSAADAQHLAAEFVGRYLRERKPWPAIALSTNTSALTAIGNDYGFDEVFARQVAAHGRAGDVLVGISTSGESDNVIRACEEARRLGLRVVTFTGGDGGELARLGDVHINVASPDTPRIQEGHILAGHLFCELVEDALCERP